MASRILKLVALVCSALLIVSFAMFAKDQASGASKTQVVSLNTGVSRSAVTVVPRHPGQPRRFIDGAAHALTAPFRSLVSGDSAWAAWISSTILALLVYGVGIGFLSRIVRLRV